MKKSCAALALALALSLSLALTAFASVTIVYSDGETSGSMTLSHTVEPSYTVTIPESVTVEFNTTTTAFGQVGLSEAKLEPDHAVQVDIHYNRTMQNDQDSSKGINYRVTKSTGSEYVGATYSTVGQYTDLFIEISQKAWDSACAGDYSDTVIFHVYYVEN